MTRPVKEVESSLVFLFSLVYWSLFQQETVLNLRYCTKVWGRGATKRNHSSFSNSQLVAVEMTSSPGQKRQEQGVVTRRKVVKGNLEVVTSDYWGSPTVGEARE